MIEHKARCKQHILSKGIEPQLGIFQEEMAELTKDISKYRRGKLDLSDLSQEMADVMICWLQLYSLIEQPVDEWIDEKIDRLGGE